MNERPCDRHPIDLLSDEFLRRYRAGERPTLAEYVTRHPELADEIRALFPVLVDMEAARPRSGDHDDHCQPLNAPRQVGDYRIIREIGRGGMGVVYEAEQLSLGRRVALKILPKKLLHSPQQRARFEREAKAAAKLHHTNIVPVFGFGEDGGQGYYVMQFIQGRSLDEVLRELKQLRRKSAECTASRCRRSSGQLQADVRLAFAGSIARALMNDDFQHCDVDARAVKDDPCRLDETTIPQSDDADSSVVGSRQSTANNRLSETTPSSAQAIEVVPEDAESASASTYWQSVARIGFQVAQALDYAHGQGVLHRDIKPANLLLDVHGTTWITDFGLAKIEDDDNLTRTGDILGTLRYMAPETFQGRTDARSEVYSLGLTLYELVAFRPAFDQRSRHALIHQVINSQIESLSRLNRAIPFDLQLIIHKAIDRDPEHRYQSVREMAKDLQRFMADDPVKARRITLPARIHRWARRNRPLAASLAALAALLLVLNIAGPLFTWRLVRLNDSLQKSEQKLTRTVADLTTAQQDLKLARRHAEAEAQRSAVLAGQKEAEAKHALQRKQQAEQYSAQLRSQLYQTEMLLAGLSREEAGGLFQVQNLTEHWLPTNPADDVRGWEWYFLNGLGYQDTRTLFQAPVNPNAIAITRDGSRVATGSQDATAKVWDVNSGRLLATMKGHAGYVLGVAWNHDGTRLATSGWDRTVRIWDAENGQQLALFEGMSGRVSCVDWSPDGKWIAAGQSNELDAEDKSKSDTGWVRIWDAASYQVIHSIRTTGSVACVRFSPEGRRLTYRDRQALSVMEPESGKTVLSVPEVIATSLAWSPGGDRIAISTRDGYRVFDAKTGKEQLSRLGHLGYVHAIAWSPDGSRLATASRDRTIILWNATTGEQVATIRGHRGYVKALQWTPDGRWLASGGMDAVKLWDTGQLQRFSPVVNRESCQGLAWSPDGSRIAMNQRGTLKILARDSGQELASINASALFRPVWSPDGSEIAAIRGGSIALYDARTGVKTVEHARPGEEVVSLAWSPDGAALAIGVVQKRVLVLKAHTGEILHRFEEPWNVVEQVVWSPTGDRLAAVCHAELHIWNMRSGGGAIHKRIWEGWIHSVTWSPDGSRLAIGTESGKVQIHDSDDGGVLRVMQGHSSGVIRVRWSPDGSRIASMSLDRTLRIWDPVAGRQTLVLKDHRANINDLAWSPGGIRLASAGDDGIRIFNAWAGYAHDLSPRLLPELARRIDADPDDLAARRLRLEICEAQGDREAARDDRDYLQRAKPGQCP